MELKSPTKRLETLEWLAALEPALRKRLRYPNGGGTFDPASEMARTRFDIALSLFAKEDRVYWSQHDPAAFPFIPNTSLGDAWAPAQRAIEAATKRWRAKAALARPDYSEAKRLLEALFADKQAHYRRDVTQVLAVIALREDEPKQVFARIGVKRGDIPTDYALYAGAAYLALGDVKRALACYNGSVVNQGFLAEARGDFAEAQCLYREGLEAGWHAVRPYAKLRVARLEQRLGKRELERLRAEDTGDKVVITTLDDFYARFADIADALRQEGGVRAPKKPLPEADIDKLRLSMTRHGKSEGVPVPESVKTILRYDCDFSLFKDAQPLLAPLLRAKGVVPSADVEKLVRAAVKQDDTMGLRALAKLPKDVPVWNSAADLPACIELASPGDQKLFLYVGEGTADEHGEYPMARFDDQPELWVSEASLIHYVLEQARSVVHCTLNFAKPLKAAKKRNAKHREGWGEHPEVTATLKRVG
ncbi:DUF5066 family protein [Myxococcus landrumensis]|uniref:DUF5066 family protein n=1 Tax=Myxococcus landrumensis TaxID=2813577 RepID=A0ABX7N4P6_9BACT|nr:DUF5066 family protein [Myxococcus landrumus]QSQ13727.1 DUF5066 family protein [Myxococcus landrumus]